MPRLNSANFAMTTLAEQILNTAESPLSFEVDDASGFPDAPFKILIHDGTLEFAGVKEIMEVGAINKVTGILSDVTRAQEGTSAQTHAIGAKVECVWTSGTHGELADGADFEEHLKDYPNHGNLKNKLINGNFDIWQRGVSFLDVPNDAFSADRFYCASGNSIDEIDVSRQVNDTANFYSDYFLRIISKGSSISSEDYLRVGQKIENAKSFMLGKTYTFSFWVRRSSGVDVRAIIGQESYLLELSSNNVWEKFSVSYSPVVGDFAEDDSLRVLVDTRLDIVDEETHDFAQIQFEEGSYATPFEQRPIALEMSLCQRYYDQGKGWDVDSKPNYNITTGSPLIGTMKNKLINGNFDVWQRGTSGSGNGYGPDRWWFITGDWLRSTDVPDSIGAKYSLDYTRADFAPYFRQHVESQIARAVYNKTIAVAVWYKSLTGTNKFRVVLRTADAEDDFSNLTIRHTHAFSGSTSWDKYTFTQAITHEDFKNGFVVEINFDASGNHARVAQVQLEEGEYATPFEYRNIGIEMLLCQRYYEKYKTRTIDGKLWLGWKAKKRVTPTVATDTGTLENETVDGTIISNNAEAAAEVTADAEL